MPDGNEPTLLASATFVVQKLQQAGYAAYFAGGSVRDQLLGKPVKDYDVATSAHPAQVLAIFPKARRVGAAFGVVLVNYRGHAVEVATFRTDGEYADGRRPKDVQFTNAQTDAQRRDFTCNGLFLDPLTGQIMDYVGGRQDINSKTLRAIGDPVQRFGEDHLRMLRAVRFAARLEFSIHPDTWAAIQVMADNLKLISRERIGQEMRFMLSHVTRGRAVRLLADSGLLARVLPLDTVPGPAGRGRPAEWSNDCLVIDRLPETAGFAVSLAALIYDFYAAFPLSDAVAGQLQNALALSGQEKADVAWLADKLPLLSGWRSLRTAAVKRLMADHRFTDLTALLQAVTHDLDQGRALDLHLNSLAADPIAPPPFVTGDDLLKMGAAAGPNFRRWLDELYDRQLENEFADRAVALEAARRLAFPDGE